MCQFAARQDRTLSLWAVSIPCLSFNEAISLLIRCANEDKIDYYWDKLSADPKVEQCGWLKDKYGVSRHRRKADGSG
ncbi:VOC family protein [Shouchella rhizosphaerae]|uniref:VOC family protein n=1 Tax=Shouchella TaxID=2893057 RepID=UPI00203E34AC|nr:VOC family protein [Shouchella rhizosphaerae]MDP0464226.1 VOC family protein [Shouchella rhizosphaerae]